MACLVEVNRKQQARHLLKAESEGGLLPAASADSGSVHQRLQPLQPLKQLQELRRRGLRAGEDSSHDCQVGGLYSTCTVTDRLGLHGMLG